MRLLRGLALATAVGAWAVIVIGGSVTATSTGLTCPNVVDCGPGLPGAELEITHRVAAWVEGFLVLALLAVVLRRYRTWIPVRNLTILSFGLVVVQAVLGMLSVYAGYEAIGWYPALVTVHLGVATAFLAVTVLNASTIVRGTPPSAVPRPSQVRDTASDAG